MGRRTPRPALAWGPHSSRGRSRENPRPAGRTRPEAAQAEAARPPALLLPAPPRHPQFTEGGRARAEGGAPRHVRRGAAGRRWGAQAPRSPRRAETATGHRLPAARRPGDHAPDAAPPTPTHPPPPAAEAGPLRARGQPWCDAAPVWRPGEQARLRPPRRPEDWAGDRRLDLEGESSAKCRPA